MAAPSLTIPIRGDISDFQRAMSNAVSTVSSATDDIAAKVSGMNSGLASTQGLLASTSLAFGGIIGVIGSLSYGISVANKGLADMQSQAKSVGLSLADLQGIKFGGAIAGLSDQDLNTGLQKSADLLNDASRNANSLSKEFDANGLSLKQANGQMITQNQLLTTAASLIQRARNPGDQNAIAQMLGFTREWIPLLQQGPAAIDSLTDAAKKAGAVIDDDTVQRAADFDDKWRKSSVEFSSYMKAALVGLLPTIDDLIEKSSDFIKGLDPEKIEQAAKGQLKDVNDALGLNIPEEGAVKVELPQDTIDNWDKLGHSVTDIFKSIIDFANDDSYMSMLSRLSDFGNSTFTMGDVVTGVKNLAPTVTRIAPEDVKWYNGTKPVMDTSDDTMAAGRNAAAWSSEGAAFTKLSSDVDAAAPKMATNFSKVASTSDDANDAVDRAINTLQKHVNQQNADANAIGLSAGEMERFRAVAAETSAVQANAGQETQAQADKFKLLQQWASVAADALARAKVASDISRGQQTALLSPDDVQIANQLKDIYADVATALGSVEASALRANQAVSGLSSQMSSDLTSGLTDITTGAKTASQGFSDMTASIIKDIEQMIIKITIVQPLMQSLQSAFGGGVSLLSGSASPLNGITGHENGGMISGPGGPRSDNIVTKVSPGEFIVNAASTSQHRSLLEAINNGNIRGFADGGMVGALSIPSLTPSARTGAGVTIVNQTGVQATAQTKTGSNGDMTIVLKKMVDQAVGDSLSSGTGRRVLGSQFGVKPFTGQ